MTAGATADAGRVLLWLAGAVALTAVGEVTAWPVLLVGLLALGVAGHLLAGYVAPRRWRPAAAEATLGGRFRRDWLVPVATVGAAFLIGVVVALATGSDLLGAASIVAIAFVVGLALHRLLGTVAAWEQRTPAVRDGIERFESGLSGRH